MTSNKIKIGSLILALTLIGGFVIGMVVVWFSPHHIPQARAGKPDSSEPITVQATKPLKGGLPRTTTQPGTVRAFEREDLYATVPGFLTNQKVDIGSEVKKGEVLAEIDAPDLVKEAERDAALVKQAKARVVQMQAALDAAKAELEVTKIAIDQKKAELRRARSTSNYREKQFARVQDLVNSKSVDQRLLDEQFDYREAAQAWVDAAEAGIKTAIADVEAKKARVAQAQADLLAAQANVDVAQAALQKAQVFVQFTRIQSHYDGVVTERHFFNGNYLRGIEQGEKTPLLQIQRTDLMRVIVQIPDTDAVYCKVGDRADLSFKTLRDDIPLPSYKVARMANSLTQTSRTMPVEVDVPNEKGILKDGMYCDVTIHLEPGSATAVRVPSSAIYRQNGHEFVFVIRDEILHRVAVHVGLNNGSVAEITSGLKADTDLVVTNPTGQMQDGQEVKVVVEEHGS
jgi:RND family efflux transporter MFP subunit